MTVTQEHNYIFKKILKETNKLVSSIEGETILVCHYIIANYLMDSSEFHVSLGTPSPFNKLMSVGFIFGNEVFIDYNMLENDLKVIAKYPKKLARQIKLNNLLDDKSEETENIIDFSHYIS